MKPPAWLTAPPLDTEKTFDKFVAEYGGCRVTDRVEGIPAFDNADYLFPHDNVVAELKTLKADVGRTQIFKEKHLALTQKYLSDGRMPFRAIFRAADRPREFVPDFLRLFRPPLEGALKKANSQLKQTKAHLGLPDAAGIVLIANDEFVSLEPEFIISIISDKLTRSFSSIDAFVYLTLNHYVGIPGDDLARLLWVPSYSPRAPDSLVAFIDGLGAAWFDFLGREIGPFEGFTKSPERSIFRGAKAIPRPKR